LRALLSCGVHEDYDIHQMDVKNAFLNGKLDKTIYLQPPAGLSVPRGKCLHLLKSIYGLKQAPRVWYHELSAFFLLIKFSPSKADPCLFVSNDTSWPCWVHVYVDDMVIVSKDVACFKKLVTVKYLMEDLGPIKHLLGMKIEKTVLEICFSQDIYVKKILPLYRMQEVRTVVTPLVPNTRLETATQVEHKEFLKLGINYCQAVGLLNYLAVSTRPDISFAMSQLSQFLEHPGTTHCSACVHLLCYLCGTSKRGLTLGGSIEPVKIFTNADYANNEETWYLYFGYVVMMDNNIISWKAKKELAVLSSTTEAEYVGLCKGGWEAIWIPLLFESLNIRIPGPIPLMCNNQAAIHLAKNTVFADRTKHFRFHLHWIRETILQKNIYPYYVSTHSNMADFLTKLLGKIKHTTCVEGINLTN
jgi:hypothetical protein